MTETTTQVERVARAIYEEDDPWHKVWPWPDLNENQGSPDQYRRIATAAIKAMGDAEPVGLLAALGTIMARMEALEDEASDALATELSVQAAGFMRGQKSTAKSLRSHLHDMTRQSLAHAAPQPHTAPIPHEQGRDEVERLREAVRKTEYKYFGDYEMTDDQREAVDILVSHAEATIAKADALSPPLS